jgi:hypothetical protein
MEIAIGIEAELRGAVVPVGQLLAGIAKRLEVANGVGMLKCGHEGGLTLQVFCRLGKVGVWGVVPGEPHTLVRKEVRRSG